MLSGITTIMTYIQSSSGTNSHIWFFIFMILIVIMVGIFYYIEYGYIPKWLSGILGAIVGIFYIVTSKKKESNFELDEAIEAAGYSYDPKHDIFYSTMDAWQRDMGYCSLYDESAAPLGMIIDCEPIYFYYDNRRWLIEFWKGQYDLTTGCEIGVYSTDKPNLNIPGVFEGPFYQCAEDEDLLQMSYTLFKNGKPLFKGKGKHWWLTGFKLGEFSEPSELTMTLSITLKDEDMRNSFVRGLIDAGYFYSDITIRENTVSLEFNKPRTRQPTTRKKETDWIIQRKNELLCEKYQDLTKEYHSLPDKINAIKEKYPELYKEVLKIGKTKQIYDVYNDIKKYIN